MYCDSSEVDLLFARSNGAGNPACHNSRQSYLPKRHTEGCYVENTIRDYEMTATLVDSA